MPRHESPAALLPLPPSSPRQPVTVTVTLSPWECRRSIWSLEWIPAMANSDDEHPESDEDDAQKDLDEASRVELHGGAAHRAHATTFFANGRSRCFPEVIGAGSG